ncbi:transglycosylase domain-containing protein [bacterium]|nr:transglycosylase domain-containing protein [bacterium]
MPDINASNLNSLTAFAESSVITDKNGEELYKLFAENREYVEYSEISPTMVQATVATEDSSFWEND